MNQIEQLHNDLQKAFDKWILNVKQIYNDFNAANDIEIVDTEELESSMRWNLEVSSVEDLQRAYEAALIKRGNEVSYE